MSVVGILIALGLLVWLAYRGWSSILLCALIAALLAGQPLLANWTQTFMSNAAGFVAQFFPIFLLGALFGKLIGKNPSVEAIADISPDVKGTKRAMLAIVLAGAFVTYGGVSLFVAFFVLAPMGHALFKAANIPQRPSGRGHRCSERRLRRSIDALTVRSNMGAPTAFSVAECSPTTGAVTTKDGMQQPKCPALQQHNQVRR